MLNMKLGIGGHALRIACKELQDLLLMTAWLPWVCTGVPTTVRCIVRSHT